MKKAYKLRDLDCAACAAKMEDAIQKIDGVKSASISFMSQRLVVESDENMDTIIAKAAAVCKKIEPDCTIEI